MFIKIFSTFSSVVEMKIWERGPEKIWKILRQIFCASQLKLANQSPSVQPSSSGSSRKNFFAHLVHCSFHTDSVYRLAAASCFRLKTIQTGAFLDGEREGGRDAGEESWRSQVIAATLS